MEKTIVMYRVDDGGVYGLFPTLPGTNNPHTCTSYQRVGQHSSADYIGCIMKSRPARPDEFGDLHQELTRIGYDLQVMHRASPNMHQARYDELTRTGR